MSPPSVGKPLSWEDTKKHSNIAREYGLEQFLHMFANNKDRYGDSMKWGDEIEYLLVKFDDKNKTARLSLRADELLSVLNPKEMPIMWQPEVVNYMLESNPDRPYSSKIENIIKVEANMKSRRQQVMKLLHPDESILSIANFPRVGTIAFTWPICSAETNKQYSFGCSKYFPDLGISLFTRYQTMVENIQLRRNKTVDINLKVFQDSCTKFPIEGSPLGKEDVIHLDSTGLGASCCALQLTYQAYNNLNEARILYDNLAVLCPILLALTAASPIFRGYLSDSDCRWNVLRDAWDYRTPDERHRSDNKATVVRRSYESINCFISKDGEKYNDIPVLLETKHYEKLRRNGVDHLFAQYIANIFSRDPILLLSEKVLENIDIEDNYYFQNQLSFNWQSVRVKPAESNTSNGWRVEFRPCEVQMTDFENASIACFITLMTRVLIAYDLTFLIPISKIDENMEIAQKRNACCSGQFWFRKNIKVKKNTTTTTTAVKEEPEHEQMTINEIINGSESFPGMVPIIHTYLLTKDLDSYTHGKILQYLQFVQNIASGKILTEATWIRHEVLSHPEYKKDSIVSDRINYDLLNKIRKIQDEQLPFYSTHSYSRNNLRKNNLI